MRLLILQQYFHPDISGNAQYMADLAVDLVRRGHAVTVIASQVVEHGPRGRAPADEWWHGVHIVRTRASGLGKSSVASRVADYSSYLALAGYTAVTLERHDVLLALTTPPLLPLVGPVVRRLRGTAFVALVEDVYPDIAIRTGHLREGSPLTVALRTAIRATERAADRVVVIGRCMRDRIVAGGVDPRRVELIPNWADGDAIRPLQQAANPMAAELGLRGKFAVVYSGNMGWGHDFATFLGAAARLPDVEFVFIGDGRRSQEIADAVTTRRLPNVRLLPYQPRDRLVQSLNLGAAALISQLPEVDGLLVPSKLYGILAAGQPVLFVGSRSCEVGLTVTEEDCGFVVSPGDVAALVEAIRRLRDEPKLRAAMSERARGAFERRFERRKAIDLYEHVLLQAIEERQGREMNGRTRRSHQQRVREDPGRC